MARLCAGLPSSIKRWQLLLSAKLRTHKLKRSEQSLKRVIGIILNLLLAKLRTNKQKHIERKYRNKFKITQHQALAKLWMQKLKRTGHNYRNRFKIIQHQALAKLWMHKQRRTEHNYRNRFKIIQHQAWRKPWTQKLKRTGHNYRKEFKTTQWVKLELQPPKRLKLYADKLRVRQPPNLHLGLPLVQRSRGNTNRLLVQRKLLVEIFLVLHQPLKRP